MVMHPYLTEQLVHERIAELQGRSMKPQVGSRSKGRRTRRGASMLGRARVGWFLVSLGLRLVGDGRRMRAPRSSEYSPAAKKSARGEEGSASKEPAAGGKEAGRCEEVGRPTAGGSR